MQEPPTNDYNWIGWAVGVGGLLLALYDRVFSSGRWVAQQESITREMKAMEDRITSHTEIRIQEVAKETRHDLRSEIQRVKSEHHINLEERVRRLERHRGDS